MHQCRMAFHAHGFHHTQGREGINKTGGTLGCSGAVFEGQTLINAKATILAIHFPTDNANGLAQ